jgi:MoaA/NifB/PqqE/SkfB family radical SAM enzyme
MTRFDQLRARLTSGIYSRLAPFSALHHKNLVKPTFVCFKLSERCNSKCVHCDIWKNQYEEPLTTDQWLHTTDELRRWLGPAHLVLTGGEVFLRRDALQIISHAAEKGMVCEVLTNGLLCEREYCEALVRAGVDQVTISLDGVTPETHFAVRRVPGMYEKIVRMVDDLDHIRRVSNSRLKILLKMVLMRPNFREAAAIADWVKERGQADIRYQAIEQSYAQEENLAWYKSSELWIHDIPAVTSVIEQLIFRKEAGYPIRNSVENLHSMIAYFEHPDRDMRKVQSHTEQETSLCLSGVNSFVVSSNGDVRWCFHMSPAGNVKTRSPQDIWESRAACWNAPCPWFP